jgi:hypothetical protein
MRVMTHRQFTQLTQLSLLIDLLSEGLCDTFERCEFTRLEALALQFDGRNLARSDLVAAAPALPPIPAVRRLALWYEHCRVPVLNCRGHLDVFSLRLIHCGVDVSEDCAPLLPSARHWRLCTMYSGESGTGATLGRWAHQIRAAWGEHPAVDSLGLSGYTVVAKMVEPLLQASDPREILVDFDMLFPCKLRGVLNDCVARGRLRRAVVVEAGCAVAAEKDFEGLMLQEVQRIDRFPRWDDGVLLA